jgi:hypothetical protein
VFGQRNIASRTTGETVDRDNLTHDQHRKMVAGALADIQARPQPEAPAEPEQPKPEADGDQISSPWVTPAITWGFVQAEIFDRWEGTEKQSMPDDLGLAIHGAVVEAQRKSAEAGRPLTPEGAMRPAVLARIVELAQAHLRSM